MVFLDNNTLDLISRCYKGGGRSPPPPVAAPRIGDQQARQVDTVKREDPARRARGTGSTILTSANTLLDENLGTKKLFGQ